jgi:hypothetical protein
MFEVTQKFNADKVIIEAAKKITNKRPKTVIDHIIKHGFISTEELKDTYGYNHPPRAARDVREEGIPLVTFKVTAKDGRSIGAYRFGESSEIEGHKLGGRKTFSKAFGCRSFITTKAETRSFYISVLGWFLNDKEAILW